MSSHSSIPKLTDKRIESEETQVLVIPLTSRTISFTSHGSPSAAPIFFFHGTPGSRHDARYLSSFCSKYDFRIIGVDRPGFGSSSFDATRTVVDWALDIVVLADHLGTETFRVVGLEEGGPYALACGAVIPPERLLSVGIWQGIGPVNKTGISRMGFDFYSFSTWFLVLYLPRLGHWWMKRSWSRVDGKGRNQTPVKVRKRMKDGRRGGIGEREIETMTMSFDEGLKQGTEGYWKDHLVIGQDWGFDLEIYQTNNIKTYMWYGSRDGSTPLPTARWMSKRMGGEEVHGAYGAQATSRSEGGNATLRVYNDETQNSMFHEEIREDILKEFLGL